MLFLSKVGRVAQLCKRKSGLRQVEHLTSAWLASTTSALHASSITTTPFPTRRSSSWPRQDQATSATTSTSRPIWITGLTRTESTINTRLTSAALRSTCLVPSTTPLWLISQDSTPLPSSADSTDGPDMTAIPTSRSTFRRSHLERSCRLSGTEPQSSSADWLHRRSSRRTSTPRQLCSIRPARSALIPQETPRFWYAQLFAPIWAVFPFPIWAPTTDGSASATAPSTTSSAAWDKVLPFWTSPTSTTLSTKMEVCFASRKWSSPESPPCASGHDSVITHRTRRILIVRWM